MSSIAMQGGSTGSGTVTLLAPSTSTNRTLTLPDATGTVLTTATAGVPVNGPAFSAYASSSQSISNTTFTKLAFQTEEFDTASCFDNATNYRFTPTTTGYYQVNGAVGFNFATGNIGLHIYKNGSRYRDAVVTCNSNGVSPNTSSLVYLNGSTDYVEMYVYQSSGGSASTINANTTFGVNFSASLVRSAV